MTLVTYESTLLIPLTVKAALKAIQETQDRFASAAAREDALGRDPLRFVRKFSLRQEQELVALCAALLAFGNVKVIGQKLNELLFDRLEGAPYRAVTTWSAKRVRLALNSYKHRTFVGDDIASLLLGAAKLQARDGGLFAGLTRAYKTLAQASLKPALLQWTDTLRTLSFGHSLTRTARHLLPDVSGPSACKRWVLLCRWISRPDDGVDLGWNILPTQSLIVPMDVHVHRVSVQLGLTREKTANWKCAEQVTAALRKLDPLDPVKYDFALCHTEIKKRYATGGPLDGSLDSSVDGSVGSMPGLKR